jgi:glycine/D-amino acid oxidase-like deaminating enzyme
VSLLQGTKLSRIAAKHASDVVRDYVEANLEGQQWLLRFAADHGVASERRPAFTYAETEEGQSRARDELEAARSAGLPVSWDPDPGLPFPTLGAVRLEDQAQLDPMSLLDALAVEFLGLGGTIHEHAPVRRVRRGSDGAALDARADTQVTAKHVVLATGMPILDRGGFFARLQPRRSYIVALRSDWIAPGMYLSSDRSARSVRSTPHDDGERLLVGGNGHVTGRHRPPPSARLGELRSWAAERLGAENVTHQWSAQDYGSLTELPYVGPLTPRDRTILIATGFDKWGFTNAIAAALTMSKLILGEPAGWSRAQLAWSARELGAVPTAVAFNAEVALWMAAGWDCPLHGSRFALDGTLLEGPATCDLARC